MAVSTPSPRSGADAADLSVKIIKIRRTDAVVGVDVGSGGGTGLAPYGRLAYKYDFSDHRNNISAFFNGNPATTFTVCRGPAGPHGVRCRCGPQLLAEPQLHGLRRL